MCLLIGGRSCKREVENHGCDPRNPGDIFTCFVIVMIAIYIRTGGIPDTLCTCVFSVCGGECGVMGWIKTTKDRHLPDSMNWRIGRQTKRKHGGNGE